MSIIGGVRAVSVIGGDSVVPIIGAVRAVSVIGGDSVVSVIVRW